MEHIIGRTLASIPSHWMYTGVFGAGLIWFLGTPDVPARKRLGAGLILTAMLMHGLWDASAAIAGDNVISILPGIVASVLISRRVRTSVRARLNRIVSPSMGAVGKA